LCNREIVIYPLTCNFNFKKKALWAFSCDIQYLLKIGFISVVVAFFGGIGVWTQGFMPCSPQTGFLMMKA
jgi:hypothetical protein